MRCDDDPPPAVAPSDLAENQGVPAREINQRNNQNNNQSLPEKKMAPPGINGLTIYNQDKPVIEWDGKGALGSGKYRYQINGGDWVETDSVNLQLADGLADGDYELAVQVKNKTVWSDSSTFKFTIDTTAPPVPTLVLLPYYNLLTPEISWGQVEESGTTYRYKLNDDPWVATSLTQINSTPLVEGMHTIKIQTQDLAGNQSAEVAGTFTIDVTNPPAPSLSGPTLLNDPYQAIYWQSNASDKSTTFRFRLNKGEWNLVTTTSIPTTQQLADGLYQLDVQVSDLAGNWSDQTTHSFELDTTPPPSITNITNGIITYEQNPVWVWLSGGGSGNYRYRFAGQAWVETTSTSLATSGGLVHGKHRLGVQERDEAGNWSAEKIGEIAVNIVNDPLFKEQWAQKNTGQYAYANNNGNVGEDVNIDQTIQDEITGNGVIIAISDDGVQLTHEDLAANVWDGGSRKYNGTTAPYTGDPSPVGTSELTANTHGTAVTGIIAASSNNIGIRGIAPGAKFVAFNFLSDSVTPTVDIEADQYEVNLPGGQKARVVNMSWGVGPQSVNNDSPFSAVVDAAAEEAVIDNHAILVKAGGNSRLEEYGTVHQSIGALPWLIMVSAVDAKGVSASYSSAGSSIWVSAPGGEYAQGGNWYNAGYPAMLTTDLSGCEWGYSLDPAYTASDVSRNPFEYDITWNGSAVTQKSPHAANAECNYTSQMNGSSAAAPVFSGAVALLLEVDDTLDWRDVKHIIASTATKIDSGHTSWVTNAAGYAFSNSYGFGRVDIDKAIAMATKHNQSGAGGWVLNNLLSTKELTYGSGSCNSDYCNIGSAAIPDDNVSEIVDTITVSGNVLYDNRYTSQSYQSSTAVVETVQLFVSILHADIGEITLELESPGGTISVLLDTTSVAGDCDDQLACGFNGNVDLDYIMATNAFYGEAVNGNWQLHISDRRTGNAGTVERWALRFFAREKE